VRAQQDREEQTALIGTALGIFALVMAAAVLGLWLMHSAFEFEVDSALGWWTVVIAGVVAVVFLVRSQRR
jgi:uncharacterized membrane protein HdeD (DUF308 family)